MANCLSYLMGAADIEDAELIGLGVTIEEKKSDGDRTLIIPDDKLSSYVELIKAKLSDGFWNEVVGQQEIIFIFKFKDGRSEVLRLSAATEGNISRLCSEFNGDPPDKTANVYKYISGNKFYHDFMMEHYADLINRE